MGQKTSQPTTQRKIRPTSHLKEEIKCPICGKGFLMDNTFNEFNIHLKQCGFDTFSTESPGDVYGTKINSESINVKSDFLSKRIQNYISKRTKPIANKDNMSFEDKVGELKASIAARKISWTEGCCQLNLTRQNFLFQSMQQIKTVNIFKELKINFKGEVSYDAGGLLREWFTIIIEYLERSNMNLFLSSDSKDFSYTINPTLLETKVNLSYFEFIGTILGKALIDNITINLCFNKIIYKLIVNDPITYDDLLFIDSPLYHSLSNLKDQANNADFDIESLCLYYCVDVPLTVGTSNTILVDLIKNGSETPVTDLNDYIEKIINYKCGLIDVFVSQIRKGLFSVIPKETIELFNADELELVLNGQPFIDIEEWKEFTEYRAPYNSSHRVIKWFWECLQTLNQKKLSNFLQFSTGTAKVPIGGFGTLESNRGEVARFTIMMIPYVAKQKNFIKAHTCFNRIEVPLFPSKELVKEAVDFVANCEILGFGID